MALVMVGGLVTLSVTAVVWLAVASVPVIVRVYVPGAVVGVVVIASVEPPPAVTEGGVRVAVTLLGAPVTAKFTVPAEPATTAVVIAEEPEAPAATVTEAGLALIEKSFDTGRGHDAGVSVVADGYDVAEHLLHGVGLTVGAHDEPSCALQMSPISPFMLSYQAIGAATLAANPTSGSVVVSTNSWVATDISFWNSVSDRLRSHSPNQPWKLGCTP